MALIVPYDCLTFSFPTYLHELAQKVSERYPEAPKAEQGKGQKVEEDHDNAGIGQDTPDQGGVPKNKLAIFRVVLKLKICCSFENLSAE